MIYIGFGLYTLSGVDSRVRRQRLALSIGPNRVGFYLMMETESSLRNVFNKNNWTMDNVQEVNYSTNEPSSQTFRSYLL
jgi:hypothetical protein